MPSQGHYEANCLYSLTQDWLLNIFKSDLLIWIIILRFWLGLRVGQLVDGLKDVDQVSLKDPWAIESDGKAAGLR